MLCSGRARRQGDCTSGYHGDRVAAAPRGAARVATGRHARGAAHLAPEAGAGARVGAPAVGRRGGAA